MKNYLTQNESVKNNSENRFIILTDVEDNSVSSSKKKK